MVGFLCEILLHVKPDAQMLHKPTRQHWTEQRFTL